MSKIKKALISVSDKTGLEEFARGLAEEGIEIISTGGTRKVLEDAGIKSVSVADYTEESEILDGRVKTIHPKIYAGILAVRNNKSHLEHLKNNDIDAIDMVVVNFYPFEKTRLRQGADEAEIIENIDIGGPCMLRAAAKNFSSVAAVSNPACYVDILKELKENNGSVSVATRKKLAADAFKLCSEYDRQISQYLNANLNPLADGASEAGGDFTFSQELSFKCSKIQDLRYGENPHQKAAFYADEKITEPSLCSARQLQGKELSLNNIMDLNAALDVIQDFKGPAACVIKHNNPCGVAEADDLSAAYQAALECDKLSAFGGIIGLRGIVDEELAMLITREVFTECILANGFTEKALAAFKKKKNIRLLEIADLTPRGADVDIKKLTGGMLIQQKDKFGIEAGDLTTATRKKPTKAQIQSMLFAWKVCKHVRSNAIVLADKGMTLGIGAGQMSRIDAVIIAVRKAGKRSYNSVMASDAFFPKEDAIEAAKKAGISAIIQPGGSIKDKHVIEAANSAGIAMVFTGIRHFKH